MKKNLIVILTGLSLLASCAGSRQNENISVEVNTKTENTIQTKMNVNQNAVSVTTEAAESNIKVLSNQISNANTAAKNSSEKPQERCGWFENPTPGNAWINDKDGEWLIGAQGGYQAEGDYPDIPDAQWVKTNINYGYGCACMRVTVDAAKKRIVKIFGSTAKPLDVCRKDKALKEPSAE